MLPLEVSFLSEQVSPVISVKEKAPFSKFYTLFIGVRVCVCGQKHVDHLFLFSVPFKNGAGKGINDNSVFPIGTLTKEATSNSFGCETESTDENDYYF